ncbi:MAG: exodeoxyribonuclease VII large subunit [Thermoplasmata archaeon]|nr:exodeoxyribonuclease VII large subunit [Thermoplasmata archaeon]
MQTSEDIKVYTVTEFASKIKGHIKSEKSFQDVYVRGEVSNFGGNAQRVYFDIKDEFSRVHVVMFDTSEALSQLKDGLSVVVHGKLDFYQRDGKLNLIADSFFAGGIGEVYLRLERLKERLRAEGLFAPEVKKPVPKYIFRVGIATSLKGAAVHDILHALQNAKGLEIYIVDTVVQGEGAKDSIVRSIRTLNSLGVDVILVARGGGSIEDLWAFNEEVVVRAIRNSRVPVITGIGHETDRTLADMAADREFPTPSYAGKFIYEQWKNGCDFVERERTELTNAVQSYLQELYVSLDLIASKISKEEFHRIVLVYKTRLEMLSTGLRNAVFDCVQYKKMQVENAETLLTSLNPEAILKQGYVYITKEDRVVVTGSELEREDCVKIHFTDVVVEAKVLEKEVKEWKLEKVLKRS